MSTLTATADAARSWVRLDASFGDVLADGVLLTRTRLDTGAIVTVRQGTYVLAPSLLFTQLNANADFETNVTNWTGTGITPTQSTTHAHRGTHAMLMTTAGAVATPHVESEKDTVVPGQTIGASAYVYPTSVSFLITIVIKFYDAGAALLSTVTGTTATTAGVNTWQQLTVTPTVAPANAATATIQLQWAGTPGAGLTAWLDEARLGLETSASAVAIAASVPQEGILTLYDTEMPLDVPLSYAGAGYVLNGIWGWQLSTATAAGTVASLGACWLKDPLRPGNTIRVDFCFDPDPLCIPAEGVFFQSLDAWQQPAYTGVFAVNDRAEPVTVSRLRGSVQSTLSLVCRTFADQDRLRAALSPGSPLLWQVPAEYGIPDMYLQVGGDTLSRLLPDHRFPVRAASLPFTAVSAPAGPAQGVQGARWDDLCVKYATNAAITSAGFTWGQLTQRAAA